MDFSWDGGVAHTILGHFDLDIDFWPHLSPILQLTFLKCVLCLTNSFGGIRHITLTFLAICNIEKSVYDNEASKSTQHAKSYMLGHRFR